MEYKNITKEVQVPVLGIGTWKMGGKYEPIFDNDEQEIAAIKMALELGKSKSNRLADGRK